MALFVLVLVATTAIVPTDGGVIGFMVGYGLCQTGCNTVYVACCAAGGVTAGTFTAGVGVAPAILACSAAQGVCMATCATVCAVAPTP